jgi:hypothetical protein
LVTWPNTSQLREGINFDLSHDWRRLFHNKGFEELVSDNVDDIPRLRVDCDNRRPHAAAASLKTKPAPGESGVLFQSMITRQRKFSYARFALLDEFSDMSSW